MSTAVLTARVVGVTTALPKPHSPAPNITANWDASDGNEWTFPLGLGTTRTTVFNGRPMSLGVQYYYNATKPQGAAGQLLRISVSLLYPRK